MRMIPSPVWLGALAAILFFVRGASAESTNSLSDAELQGRALVQKILAQQPGQNYTNTGVLEIRDGRGKRLEIPVEFEVLTMNPGWQAVYETKPGTDVTSAFRLRIVHSDDGTNKVYYTGNEGGLSGTTGEKRADGSSLPFAGSDFWLCDLSLDFFRWPEQKVLPKTTNLKRGRDYTLLESINPSPSTNGYSRVVSWIDRESNGILEAEAYDANGKALKYFEPKNFEKVNGQYQLESMIMENLQTGSRSKLEFDLNK